MILVYRYYGIRYNAEEKIPKLRYTVVSETVYRYSEIRVYRSNITAVYHNTVHTSPRYTGIPAITGIPSYPYKPGIIGIIGISMFLPEQTV